MMYQSTKRFGPISVGHRQWRDDGHCRYLHGYGRTMKVVFGANSLDDKMWVVDFGGLKEFRSWLNSQWDHRCLIASDDPLLPQLKELEALGGIDINVMDVTKGYGPGIEGSCKFVFDYLNNMIVSQSNGRCWVQSIEIFEHENNSALYINPEHAG